MRANNHGFTMIEVMITIVILFVGIMAMSLMQVGAIKGNSSAFSRSVANTIALTFIEELKRMPFDDISATAGANLDAGSGANPNPAAADNQYTAASFPNLAGLFTVDGNYIVDKTGKRFQLFWNVANNTITLNPGAATPTVVTHSCTIRLFMYWDAPQGRNSLSITTLKYNS